MDYENESLDARLWIGGYSAWHYNMCHDVPYRAMVTKKVENLLVACRAAGMTHDAHQLFRMQRDIQALGEAASVAAAVSIRNGTNVRKVDVKALQKRLVERNALPPQRLKVRVWALRLNATRRSWTPIWRPCSRSSGRARSPPRFRRWSGAARLCTRTWSE
jgi:hypothetical protein